MVAKAHPAGNNLVARITGAAPGVMPTLLSVIEELQSPWADPTAADWGVFLALVAKAARVVSFDAAFLAGVDEIRRLVIIADPDGESDQDEADEKRVRFCKSDDAANEQRERILVERSWSHAA